MRILGIETSCDETAIAILEVKGKRKLRFRILSNVIASQAKLHAKYGGVYPSLAKREHQKNLPLVLKQAIRKAKIDPVRGSPPQRPFGRASAGETSNGVDAIAVTQGPGLDPCLWAGIEFAKNLARKMGVPLIPVNHMEGHLLVSLLLQGHENVKYQMPNAKTIFPAIALLVSGGHTQLILVKGIGKYRLLGETRDDAAGECFDKTARMLGLSYPGGPAIATEAAKIRSPKYQILNTKYKIHLPLPMISMKNYDFSFSGLKTAVLYNYQSQPEKIRRSKEYIQTMAKEIQQAIIDVLISKTVRAAREYDAKSIILGGGVAANTELRKQLAYKIQDTKYKIHMLVAPKELCTDNGLMPALAGFFNLSKKKQGAALNRIAAKPNVKLQ